MNLSVLQKEAHQIAIKNGWWDEPPKCINCDFTAMWDEGRMAYFDEPDELPKWFCENCGGEVPSRLVGPIEERTFGDLIAQAHGALSKALEMYQAPATRSSGDLDWRWVPVLDENDTDKIVANKPIGVAGRLADAMIRLADLAEHYGISLQKAVTQAHARDPEDGMSFGDEICVAHLWLSSAFGAHARGNTYVRDAELGKAVVSVQALASHYDIDLDAAIKAKMNFNRTRTDRLEIAND